MLSKLLGHWVSPTSPVVALADVPCLAVGSCVNWGVAGTNRSRFHSVQSRAGQAGVPQSPGRCHGAAVRGSRCYPSRIAVIRTVSKFMTNEPP